MLPAEETRDTFKVTLAASPSVYFHLPVFTGKRQRCQHRSLAKLQSPRNYCWGRGGLERGGGMEGGSQGDSCRCLKFSNL